MKIIIAGAGEVGTHLAKLLSKEEQDIILIDADIEKLQWIDSNYNLMTVAGSPTSFKVLKKAGVNNADLFIAVMPFESRNITACTLATKLGAKKTVARIDNYEYLLPENRAFFRELGVDELIYPEMLAAEEIVTALKRTWVRNWFELCNGELILIGVKLREKAQILNHKLCDLTRQNNYYHIAAIKRNEETIIPRGNDELQLNDIVYFTTTPDHIQDIRELTGKTEVDVRKVMIMGGSRIAIRLIHIAPEYIKMKLIECDREKSFKLVEKMHDTVIIHGDARDIDLLKEEGIRDTDAFIALTDSSETNILACLTAKRLGVAKTIAEVENIRRRFVFNEEKNIWEEAELDKKALVGRVMSLEKPKSAVGGRHPIVSKESMPTIQLQLQPMPVKSRLKPGPMKLQVRCIEESISQAFKDNGTDFILDVNKMSLKFPSNSNGHRLNSVRNSYV